MILETLNQISNCSSSNEKLKLLKFYNDIQEPVEQFKEMLRLIYSSDIVFGITSKQINITSSGMFNTFPVDLYKEVLRVSGRNDKISAIKTKLGYHTKKIQEFFLKGLDKNLGIGISVKTINKAFPDLIPVVEIMLASPQDEDVFNRTFADTDYVYVNLKIDGIRMTYDSNTTEFLSREDKGISDFVLENIRPEAIKYFGSTQKKFDGELNAPSFNQVTKCIRRKKIDIDNTVIRNKCVYTVFDFIDTTLTLEERVKYLSTFKDTQYIKFLPYIKVKKDYVLLCSIARKMIAQGHEGIMVKHPKSNYEFKRSHMWMKFKDHHTEDVRILKCNAGAGKFTGMLGSFTIDFYGVEVDIGTGFSDDERKEFWEIRNELIDKMCEISYIERTKDGSLRHPGFERLRFDRSR